MSYLKALVLSAVVALAIVFMIQNIDALSHPLAIRLNLVFVQFESTPTPPTWSSCWPACGLLAASLPGVLERSGSRTLMARTRSCGLARNCQPANLP